MITLILAAGKGTRMNSSLPKVLHKVAGKPMLSYGIDAAKKMNSEKIIIVVGSESEQIMDTYKEDKNIIFCLQKEQKGTADAVLAAKSEFAELDTGVLILYGDMPNVCAKTLQQFIEQAKADHPHFISTKPTDPNGYGRVVRSTDGGVIKIIEEKDAKAEEKKIKEINTGVYYCNSKILLERLSKVNDKNEQHEFYLTDIIHRPASVWLAPVATEFLGINDRIQLTEMSSIIWKKRAHDFMKAGVTIIDPTSVYIDPQVQIENDVTIYPNVHLEGKTSIKSYTIIMQGVRIEDSIIEKNCLLKDNTIIEESMIGAGCTIGPMAHLRKDTKLLGENQIGNFVETKSTTLGYKSKAAHLTYLGNCEGGEKINFGCGTITCNYDGFNKHKTTIGDNVFVGSDVQLVAPVKIGNNAIIGAGTTVTADVPDDALALSRTKQKNYLDKASTIRKLKSGK